jgi:hypothetical protein
VVAVTVDSLTRIERNTAKRADKGKLARRGRCSQLLRHTPNPLKSRPVQQLLRSRPRSRSRAILARGGLQEMRVMAEEEALRLRVTLVR